MNLRRTRAMARKEFIHIIRDPRSLIMALAVPVVMLLLFGYALTLDVDRIPMLIYDADRSPQSHELIERFEGSRYFSVIGMVDGYSAIEKEIDKGRCLLACVIPGDYAENMLSGKKTDLQFIFDGSDSNTASIAVGYAEAMIQQYIFESGRIKDLPVEADLRVMYNSEIRSKNYIVPGLIAVIMMIIASLLTSLTIAREWEMGTMEQLLSTPLRATEIVLGKMAAFFCVGFIDTLITIAMGVFIFRIPLRGSVIFVLATSCIFLFGALCMGIMISALTKKQLMAYQLGMLASFLPAFLLSGFIFAIDNMPPVIRVFTLIVPARYFIIILKGIFLKGIGIRILWVEVFLLIIFSCVVFLVATRKLKKRLV